jgi:proline iminopeptidase
VIRKFFRIASVALPLLIGAYFLKAFIPSDYGLSPPPKTKHTGHWNLPTGSRIAYTHVPAVGPRNPHPIIFLQGGPGGFISERTIKTLSPLSEEGYDIYFYDQIGSGQSDRLEDITEYSADRHQRDLEEIIRRIGAEKVILIGQSWGAILATLLMSDHPGLVQTAIFTGPGPIQPMRQGLSGVIAPDSLNLQDALYSNKEANEQSKSARIDLVVFWAKSFGAKLASDEEMDGFQTILDGELNKATVCDTSKAVKAEGGGGFYAQVMTMRSLSGIKDPRPKLRGLTIPILVMKGQCDNQPWGAAKEYLELFPNHQLKIIPGAGHSISVEQPEVYLETIRDFLRQTQPFSIR